VPVVVVINREGFCGWHERTWPSKGAILSCSPPYHPGNLVAPIAAGVEAAMVKNLTVLVGLALDEQLIVVKADAPLPDPEGPRCRGKEKGGAMSVGGTTTGQDDHICNRLFERSAGIKTRYVSFNSGGEVMTALLGGHVDYIWANPAEFAPQLECKTGETPGRGQGVADCLPGRVPTIKSRVTMWCGKCFAASLPVRYPC